VFHRWPGWVKQQPLPFLQWMTRHAIAYMSDPKGWLGVRPISVRPSQLRPVARFGPPPGVERLPIEEVI
jgi:hypothetical protein